MASPTAPRPRAAMARARDGQVACGGQGQDPPVPAAVPGRGRGGWPRRALADTLDAVARCGAGRRILALDGQRRETWIPPGFEIMAQRGTSFVRRLAAAWSDAAGPGLQIGMDTPQVSARSARPLPRDSSPAGRHRLPWPGRRRRLVGDRPSRTLAGRRVHRRADEYCRHGRRPADPPPESAATGCWTCPELRDVDTIDDATAVAALVPGSRFARSVAAAEALAC